MLRKPLLILVFACLPVAGCGQTDNEPKAGKPAAAVPTAAEATVADQPALTSDELLPTINWKDAPYHIGEKVFLVGQVVNTGKSSSGHQFLNFGRRRSDVTGFIHHNAVDQFPEASVALYKGKKVRVRGELYRYRGNPNIRILGPEQIVVLQDDVPLSDLVTSEEPVKREVTDVLTIATLNVLNLFDSADDPYHKDEETNAKLREDLDLLAKNIHEIDADILVLQEVENRGYLDDFNRALLADLDYEHVILTEGNDRRGIDVAVLSRLPVGPVTSYRHLKFPDADGNEMHFRRDLLRVHIEPEEGDAFEVMAVHLKSKYGGEQGDVVRIGEARMIRKVLDGILARDREARLLICGDFNDLIDSPALVTILGTGTDKLASFFQDVPPAERITYNQEPYLAMVDFILASSAMAARYVEGSYQILPGSPSTTGSDHNAVVARFRID